MSDLTVREMLLAIIDPEYYFIGYPDSGNDIDLSVAVDILGKNGPGALAIRAHGMLDELLMTVVFPPIDFAFIGRARAGCGDDIHESVTVDIVRIHRVCQS